MALFSFGQSSQSEVQPQDAADLPQHIAIIMDGNGRWARKRFLPRVAGHKRGVDSVRAMVRACIDLKIPYLTLFAFSSENWRRPKDEVSFLMQLFLRSLEEEIARMHEKGIRLRVIGDISRFDTPLVKLIQESEALTANNKNLNLTIAANYGGRWDIMQAMNALNAHTPPPDGWTEEDLSQKLSLAFAPDPDLFIRTGGEKRISNFMLWQLAYTEMYFTDKLWPEFDEVALSEAIDSYKQRERRFGRTSEQIQSVGRIVQESSNA